MTETQALLDAYAHSRSHGIACVLATITFVEGSSYRRVGARMLVTEDGDWVGCVSGGCLERDLLRRAAFALTRNEPELVTYDTRDDSDEARGPTGAGLGCNGIIEILLEPILAGEPHPVLDKIAGCCTARRCGGVILFPHHLHAPAIIWDDVFPSLSDDLPGWVRSNLRQSWSAIHLSRQAIGVDYADGGERLRVFIESLRPALQVAVIGAGYDAVAMAALGVHLGHEVSVVDLRSGMPIPRRAFAGVKRYIQCSPDELPAHLPLDRDSVVVVMTHQAKDDLAILPYVLNRRPVYLGLLGPKVRGQRLLDECIRHGITPGADDLASVHFPTGLDIGAESPAEIALAVFAEIQAVLKNRTGGFLSERQGPIHARQAR